SSDPRRGSVAGAGCARATAPARPGGPGAALHGGPVRRRDRRDPGHDRGGRPDPAPPRPGAAPPPDAGGGRPGGGAALAASAARASSPQEPDRVLGELAEELAGRLRAGEPVDIESFLAEHAEQAEALRRLLPAIRVMADLGRSPVREAAGRAWSPVP